MKLAERFGLNDTTARSMVLIDANRCYTHSTASLEIARRLDQPWPALYALKLVPRFVRDAAYGFISRNRYRLFGRSCAAARPEVAARIIEKEPG